jgi:flagellar basal-body rod modification protein FlgD
MASTINSVSQLAGTGAPKPGISAPPVNLLDSQTRQALGLPAATTATPPKSTLDGTPNGLGKDDFLKLLLAQLANQDPLQPLDDKEFIAQLAQFNSLEQMQQMNQHLTDMITTQSLSEASALIGKYVETAGGSVSGEVSGVTMLNGKPQLTVGDSQIAVADVVTVLPQAPADSGTSDSVTPANPAVDGGTTGTSTTSTGTTTTP